MHNKQNPEKEGGKEMSNELRVFKQPSSMYLELLSSTWSTWTSKKSGSGTTLLNLSDLSHKSNSLKRQRTATYSQWTFTNFRATDNNANRSPCTIYHK